MTIQQGDTLIMMRNGVEQIVEACTGVVNSLVQVKNRGTFFPCPVADLHEPYVLTDPMGKGLNTNGPIYVKPNGQTTEDLKEAKLFKDKDGAEEFRKTHTGIGYFEPKPLKNCQ